MLINIVHQSIEQLLITPHQRAQHEFGVFGHHPSKTDLSSCDEFVRSNQIMFDACGKVRTQNINLQPYKNNINGRHALSY